MVCLQQSGGSVLFTIITITILMLARLINKSVVSKCFGMFSILRLSATFAKGHGGEVRLGPKHLSASGGAQGLLILSFNLLPILKG